MAQFTVHGRLKQFPFNADALEPKDPFLYNLLRTFSGSTPIQLRTYKLRKHPGSASKLQSYILGTSSHRLNTRTHSSTVSVEAISPDDGYDSEVESDELACFRGLVVDISYRPVNVVCWKRAICLEFMEKADVLEYYDQTVNSPNGSFYIPAVLRVPRLMQVVKRRRVRNILSRKNIFYRDNFMCQYCSSPEELTIDHVLPIVRGGEWKWENLVTACAKCNSKKGRKTLEEANMKLIKVPKAPKDFDILAIPLTNAALKMLRIRNGTPQEWRQYLGPSSDP